MHRITLTAIITGSDKYECIKVWDPRSSTRSCVYDLSTGNNPATSLAWDASRHTLYAATECEDTKSFEYGRKYIKKKVPKPQRPRTQSEMDDSEYESEDFEWRRWPANAYHDDEYYGYVYDSGGHRICKSRSYLCPRMMSLILTILLHCSPLYVWRECRPEDFAERRSVFGRCRTLLKV